MTNLNHPSEISLSEVNASVDTTKQTKGWKKIFAFFGPAYLVSVGYMDPGNWATDLQGGAQFGYQLIWVLLMSNLMALLLQNLSARLGIVARQDLAQANRDAYPPITNFFLYILAEIAIAACDLAEVLGMALGIYLLTGLPILWGIGITLFDTLLLLWLQKFGIRKLEAFIIALVIVIGASFMLELYFAKPAMGEVVKGFIPTRLNKEALYIAVGIIGATVMPHNLYLHSALVQTRKIAKDNISISKALRFNLLDSTIALNAAFFVNTAILVLAATLFYTTGNTHVAKIEDAHKLLSPLLGNKLAPIIFSIALIASGQSSTITGTLAGQIIMEGYLHLRINPSLRRVITRLLAIIPAMLTIFIYGDNKIDTLLVLSQVILSIQLGFAVIPLIHFVSDKNTMGKYALSLPTKVLAWIVAGVLITLNVTMVAQQAMTVFEGEGMIGWKFIIAIFSVLFVWLLLATTFMPIIQTKLNLKTNKIHGSTPILQNMQINPIHIIAVALDFTPKDEKLIAYALSQGHKDATYVLIHVVESASAKYLEEDSDDDETRKDKDRLINYALQLTEAGYAVKTHIGYKNRIKEIVRIVHDSEADLLVMGAHRHKGIKDYLFGATIEAVRHEMEIPVLIVNV